MTINTTEGPEVIVVDSAPLHSSMYRAAVLKDVFDSLHITYTFAPVEEIEQTCDRNLKAVFFIRHACCDQTKHMIDQLKMKGVKIVADFDDLIFREDIFSKIDGVRFLSKEEKDQYFYGFSLYRRMLEAADMAILSTQYLSQQALAYNKNCVAINNYPLNETLSTSSRVLKSKKCSSQAPKVIGYYSGTLTHQLDFKQCEEPLSSFLEENKDWKLRIVGKFLISEFPHLERVRHQIEVADIMSYKDMIEDISSCRVVLAPLVMGDDFCESKSELKYFDAALVKTPTIATPTTVFKSCIRHKVNGFLAATPKEWRECLNHLLSDGNLNAIGHKAFQYAISLYGKKDKLKAYSSVLEKLSIIPSQSKPLDRRLDTPNRFLKMGVLLPDIMIGSGGHRKVLSICNRYVLLGGDVEIAFMSDKSDQELERTVTEYYFHPCGKVRAYREKPINCDVAVATFWTSAYEIQKWSCCHSKYYFMQDYEPFFYPVSTNYALSRSSYALGLKLVCLGRWNKNRLDKEFGISADCVDFPVNREIYFSGEPQTRPARPPIVLFYARPSQPRRLYEFGIKCLQKLSDLAPSIDIRLFGEDISDNTFFSYGKVVNEEELAQLYRQSDLGIAFSTTNPSLIPFEMLACGLPVIDIDIWKGDAPDFCGCNAYIPLPPDLDIFVDKIIEIISSIDSLDRLKQDALEWSKRLITEDDYTESVISYFGLPQ